MINVTDTALNEVKRLNTTILIDGITERNIDINHIEQDSFTKRIPRNGSPGFPPRLIQLSISLRRECQDKMRNQNIFDNGNFFSYKKTFIPILRNVILYDLLVHSSSLHDS